MSIEQDKLNLAGLFPDFTNLVVYPETAEQLSALFVAMLIFVAIFFFFLSVIALQKALIRTRWLSQLLKNETSQTVVKNRLELLEKARRVKNNAGHLWKEFDETLVEARVGEDIHLHNIYDAGHFFNSSTLAGGITESRMLAAVPGFLTALGVIGTFVGLQLGLSELNIGNDVAVQEMKNGLAQVISGAKIAFMTSVWGVTLSVVFNFIEKWFEHIARSQIHSLQVRIDELFPRLSAEGQLQRIAEDGYESREALQGMAERIGQKMQESLIEATSGIQRGLEEALEKIMAPAIDRLVNETTDGSQKALEQLVEGFLGKFGEQGEIQRKALDDASKGVGDALASMNQTLEGFVRNLSQSQEMAATREQQLVQHISHQVDELVEKNAQHGKMLTSFMNQQVEKISDVLEKSGQAQEVREVQLGQRFASAVTGMGQSVSQTLEGFRNNLEKSQDAAAEREQKLMKHISEQIDELVTNSTKQADLLAAMTRQEVENLTETLDQARKIQEAREIELGNRFEKVVAGMSDSLKLQASTVTSLMEQGRALQEQVEISQANLEVITDNIHEGASELHSAAAKLREYGEGVRLSTKQLAGVIEEAAASTSELASENQKSATAVSQVHQQLSKDIEALNKIAEKLGQVVQTADSTFSHLESHQQRYLAALKENVQELSEHGTKLLRDYADVANARTKRHLDEWANHTTNYAEQMTSVARALSSVVDEIEGKVRK